MTAPLNLEEGQSSTRPPRFNGHFYSWWKVRIHDYLMAEDSELCDIVLDGPFIPMMEEKDGEKTNLVPKPRQKYDEADRKKIGKGYKAKTLLVCGIGPDEFNRTAHEGTEQVKESKIDMLTSRKVDAITEAKDLKVLTMDALIVNLKTHEMNQNYDLSKKEAKKDKSLMLKYKSDEDSSDDDMCGKAGHFIKECPLLKNENKGHQKPRSDKENRRDLVLGKRDRRAAADLVVKKALAAWGDSSSDSEDPDEPNDVSLVAVHEEETVFNEMFALMAHTENEEEDNQVTLLDMKNDLDKYSLKKLRTFAKVMIDSVIELTSERDTMNAELDSLTENKVKLEKKMSRMVSLESDNSELKNQLNQITEEAEKLNGMSNGLQAEI
ncbi:uncharacterized protein [Solanum lycopersicum]|uniref:uncharacterized protein n=1 Tax=Solanum lycopersicum TaxID=4081 RepID=UPI003748DF7C